MPKKISFTHVIRSKNKPFYAETLKAEEHGFAAKTYASHSK
jgi:hypothetical protein